MIIRRTTNNKKTKFPENYDAFMEYKTLCSFATEN